MCQLTLSPCLPLLCPLAFLYIFISAGPLNRQPPTTYELMWNLACVQVLAVWTEVQTNGPLDSREKSETMLQGLQLGSEFLSPSSHPPSLRNTASSHYTPEEHSAPHPLPPPAPLPLLLLLLSHPFPLIWSPFSGRLCRCVFLCRTKSTWQSTQGSYMEQWAQTWKG